MSEHLKGQFRVVQSVYKTLMVGVLAYGAIAYWIVATGKTTPIGENSKIVNYLFLFISMVCVTAVPTLRQVMLKVKPGEGLSQDQLVSKLYKTQMVVLGLCEVPACFGMVGAILSHNLSIFFILLTVSYAGLYHYRPKWREWEAYIQTSSSH